MSIFSDLYGIQESTLYDKSDLLHFPLSEPLKKYFNLEITNLAKEILDANCVIIWNFDDPFSNENELLEKQEQPELYYIEHIMPKKIELNKQFIQNPTVYQYFRIILLTLKKIVS